MDFKFKDRYDFDDLVEIVRCLRQPDGCPWDKVQTHKTIRQDFIEETYEVIEAIDNEDMELLREELGDVLLQVVFHAQIEREKSVFDINDVANDVCQKLIIRHPHVFGDVNADTTEKVLDNWDKIKMQTKSQSRLSESMALLSSTMMMLGISSLSAAVESSVPTSTSRTLARRVIMAASGRRLPFSHRVIVEPLTNISFPSCFCESPFSSLSFRRFSENNPAMPRTSAFRSPVLS